MNHTTTDICFYLEGILVPPLMSIFEQALSTSPLSTDTTLKVHRLCSMESIESSAGSIVSTESIEDAVEVNSSVLSLFRVLGENYRLHLINDLPKFIFEKIQRCIETNGIPYTVYNNVDSFLNSEPKPFMLLVSWNPLNLYPWIDHGGDAIVYSKLNAFEQELGLRQLLTNKDVSSQ